MTSAISCSFFVTIDDDDDDNNLDNDGVQMSEGEGVLHYTNLTNQQMSGLPHEAVQALQDMSGAVFQTDASGMIHQTVEGPDGQQTVIILQVRVLVAFLQYTPF